MSKAEFIALQEAALDEANELLGDSFTYKGAEYTGVISEVEFTADLLTGGQIEGLGAVLVIPKTQLGVKPAVGDTMKVNGSLMRVEKVKEDATSYAVTAITAAT